MKFRTKVIGGVSALALLVGGGTAAYAAIPDSDDGEIHACFHPATGNLRVVDDESGASCHASETQLSWNQTGPKGDTGAPGPQGEAGATGPQGPAGPLHPTYRKTVTNSLSEQFQFTCDSGDRLLSEHVNQGSGGSTPRLVDYVLDANDMPIGAEYTSGAGSTVTYFIICMDLP